ncbi:hypothetical protein C8R43DRAFT_1113767 [Mycena crocata]|nr:hypothetical protein C8R43DRAFT_1113767 [Mycena crocata]
MGNQTPTDTSAVPRRTSARSKNVVQDENKRPQKNAKATLSDRINGHIDPYSEEMDVKFNIEGSTVQEVVFLRQSNDLAQQTIQDHATENARLQAELEALKERFATDISNQGREDVVANTEEDKLTEELEKAKAANAELRKRVQVLTAGKPSATAGSIQMVPRPAGSAGKDFNIQDAMGLCGNEKDHEMYKALMRNVRELTHQAGVNWELPWAKTPADVKAKLFAVARERHPIFKRYVNDWATEELVKQYIKNKRRNAYKNGWLEAPAEYAYLKSNSAKRDPSARRGRRKVPKVATADAKKAAKKRAAVDRAGPSKKVKGKARAKQEQVVVQDDDESMSDASGHSYRGRNEEEDDE